MRRVIAQLGVQRQIAGQNGFLSIFLEIEGEVALYAGFLAAAQVFHGKIEIFDMQRRALRVHVAHFALAHHQAHQLHGQFVGGRGSGRGLVLRSLLMRLVLLSRSGGHGLAFAHFQYGIVQTHLAHHQIAGEQRGQLQFHHAALDGHGKALAVLDFAPVGLPELHAGRQQREARRAGEDQGLAGGFGCGVGNLFNHKLRVNAAEQYGSGHAQHNHDAQNPKQNTFHAASARMVHSFLMTLSIYGMRPRPASRLAAARACRVRRSPCDPVSIRQP